MLALSKIIESLQYLARQGIPFQGDTDTESNVFQILKLRAKDDKSLLDWLSKKGPRFISHDIQNELLSIMANHIIRNIASDVQKNRYYSIICDEYTDISNHEQLTFCLRWVDSNMAANEDFIGFYEVPNIKSETIFTAINDILARLGMSLDDCRGQCYDGASNMFGKNSGVAQKIIAIQPKAAATHCYAHSLSLGVKDMVCNCKCLSDTLDTSREIIKLIKYSPLRQNLLGEIKNNLVEDEQDIQNVPGILPLCPTRWTVRAKCFKRIIGNYSALMEEWEICLEDKLNSDIRARIIGCQSQMKTFSYFFGLHLSQLIFSHTDNLSKTLQSSKISATSAQTIADLTKKTLASIRTDDSFDLFYANILKSKENLPDISPPVMPRKRRAPQRFEIGEGEPSYVAHPRDMYRIIFFEAIDLLVAAIDQRFDQPAYKEFCKLENLLIKYCKSNEYTEELEFLQLKYGDEIDIELVETQLPIFKTMMVEDVSCFEDVLCRVQTWSIEEKSIVSEIFKICKLLHVNPATTATGERSFSSARRLKTWQRSTMTQRRFNSITVLNNHKRRTDDLSLHTVANDFIQNHTTRCQMFHTFTASHFNRT